LYYSGFDNAGWVAADDIGSLGTPPWKDGPLTVHKGSLVAAMVAPPISLSILEARGALDNKLLPLKTDDIRAITTSSRFGIGLYTDTPGSPTYEAQLDAALDLVGERGWVTIFLCAWRTHTTSCINKTTTHDPQSTAMLQAAYSRKLNVRPHTPLEQRLSFVTDTPPVCHRWWRASGIHGLRGTTQTTPVTPPSQSSRRRTSGWSLVYRHHPTTPPRFTSRWATS
jgi:hypothetical protein